MTDLMIYQGYESPAINNFRFNTLFKLEEYKDKHSPLVVFGCYKRQDLSVIYSHKSTVVIVWVGNDSLKIDFTRLKRMSNAIHATWLPRVKQRLEKEQGIEVTQLKFPAREQPNPLVMGGFVYTYLNKLKPEYHGSKLIDQLSFNGELLIGNHSIKRQAWWGGIQNSFYQRCFIGLFLSEYTGGAMGVVEMGLRGIKCITNVLNLPHCIHWNSLNQIEERIQKEKIHIGTINKGLANDVYSCLAKDFIYFDLQKMKK